MLQGAVSLQDGGARIACDIESAPDALLHMQAYRHDGPLQDFQAIFNQPCCFIYRHRVLRTSYSGRVNELIAIRAHSFDVLLQVRVELHGERAQQTNWELLVNTTPVGGLQGSGVLLLQLFPMLMVHSDIRIRCSNAPADAHVTVSVVGEWLPDKERMPLFDAMDDASLVQRLGDNVLLTIRNGFTTASRSLDEPSLH